MTTLGKGLPVFQPAATSVRTTAMPNMVARSRTALLLTFAFIAFLFFFKSYPSRTEELYEHEFTGDTYPRVAKVSMLYGKENFIYERALRSHRIHDERNNYPFHVLRHELDSKQGYWNKPSYLFSLLVNELAKPPGQRVEWLMWVDADLVLINPAVPLETFLPPYDFSNIHFLGNKDHHGLNTGTFFIRVHEWSIRMLAKSIAFPMYHPEIDLHVSVDQEAMAHVLNETEFSSNVLFQPRPWYNTYEWHHKYEGRRGNLLVHFPGLEDDRWKHMNDWLITVEQYPKKWEVPLQDTFYPNETIYYWDVLRAAVYQLHEAEVMLGEKGGDVKNLDPRVYPAWEKAKRALLFDADNIDGVRQCTIDLMDVLRKVKNAEPDAAESDRKPQQDPEKNPEKKLEKDTEKDLPQPQF